MQIAQRSIRNIISPEILLNLKLQKRVSIDNRACKAEKYNEDDDNIQFFDNDSIENMLLQTDPLNLINLTNKLEEALNENKSNYPRRIIKNVN